MKTPSPFCLFFLSTADCGYFISDRPHTVLFLTPPHDSALPTPSLCVLYKKQLYHSRVVVSFLSLLFILRLTVFFLFLNKAQTLTLIAERQLRYNFSRNILFNYKIWGTKTIALKLIRIPNKAGRK